MFVPVDMLFTPQMFAVLVKSCWLIITAVQEKPAEIPNGITCSSSLTEPFRTSPTSNAINPPGLVIRNNSLKTSCMIPSQSVSFLVVDIFFPINSASRPLNQHLSQLSAAYCTISKKGGDVTVRETVLSKISGVSRASFIRKSDDGATFARFSFCFSLIPCSNDQVFFRIISRTSRYGGVWLRSWFMVIWRSGETAWFGGRV